MPEKFSRFSTKAALALALFTTAATPQNVGAATATTSFQVSLTVVSECVVGATPMDFGTRSVVGGPVTATSVITVTCTAQTPFTVGLGNGVAGTTPGNRVLQGPNGATVSYALYKDAAFATLWGTEAGTVLSPGQATGLPQPFTVHGRIPGGQTAAAPGAYTDTISVTVTY